MKNPFLILVPLLLTSCVYWTPASREAGNAARVIPDVPLQVWDIKSCGAGSLSSVLQHHGEPTTMQEWDAILPKTRGGVMSIDLVLAARQRGFDARLVTGDRLMVERELLDGNPLILMLQVIQAPGRSYDFFHYVVLDGIDTERSLIRTQFGDGRARWVRHQRIENAWRGGGFAAIVIRPRDEVTDLIRTAVTLEEQGREEDAAREYRRILEAHPASVLAWTNLGNVEMRRGNAAAAEEAFRKAVALDAIAADALNNLAWLLYQQRRLDEAEPLARRAIEAPAPDLWMRLDTLAHIQLERGACSEAARTWRQALEVMPASRAGERDAISQSLARAQTCGVIPSRRSPEGAERGEESPAGGALHVPAQGIPRRLRGSE
ncbi:MAG TPA: tetratricopeptide repeat protein [Thermoanaerobaculia bacterium]|nr:tetratricopeptide repeat protein [Thermoanaerobaculia bacterium]